MSFEISATPTEDELQVLRLLLPGGFRLSRDPPGLRLTFFGLDDSLPLVDFVISPQDPTRGLAGRRVSALLEDLAGTLLTSHRVLSAAEGPAENRINDLVDGTLVAVLERLDDPALVVSSELHTLFGEDWFGD